MKGATVLVDGHVRLCRFAGMSSGELAPCKLGCPSLDRYSGRCKLSPFPTSELDKYSGPCIEIPVGEWLEKQREG